MNSFPIYEELDQAIERIAQDESQQAWPAEVSELEGIAAELRHLPRPDFKNRLMVELEWAAAGRALADGQGPDRPGLDSLPTLSGRSHGLYPVRGSNMAASVAMHMAALLLISSGFVMVKSTVRMAEQRYAGVTTIDAYVPNAGSKPNHGGGSGSGSDNEDANKGRGPRFAREQIVPPSATARSKIMMEATLVGPPDLNLSKPDSGDPLSILVVPSTGMGTRTGIGNNGSGGDGPGNGHGQGPGSGGGSGDDYYLPGDGVNAPRAIYSPEPDYSDEARHLKHQGVVTLLAIVGADGRPKHIQIARSLGMGLDEKAVDAVRTWKFEPGTKNGRPVAVQIVVEVDFHLF